MGELVLTEPMPSMPVLFWGDDDGMARYRDSYFDTYPGVWRHGDWIAITADGGCVIYGRSDTTINGGASGWAPARSIVCCPRKPERCNWTHRWWTSRAPGHEGWMLLFVVPATA